MHKQGIDRRTNQLSVQLFAQFICDAHKGHELSCANRREVGRVAMENVPLALVILGEGDNCLGRHSRERRGRLANEWHLRPGFFNFNYLS